MPRQLSNKLGDKFLRSVKSRVELYKGLVQYLGDTPKERLELAKQRYGNARGEEVFKKLDGLDSMCHGKKFDTFTDLLVDPGLCAPSNFDKFVRWCEINEGAVNNADSIWELRETYKKTLKPITLYRSMSVPESVAEDNLNNGSMSAICRVHGDNITDPNIKGFNRNELDMSSLVSTPLDYKMGCHLAATKYKLGRIIPSDIYTVNSLQERPLDSFDDVLDQSKQKELSIRSHVFKQNFPKMYQYVTKLQEQFFSHRDDLQSKLKEFQLQRDDIRKVNSELSEQSTSLGKKMKKNDKTIRQLKRKLSELDSKNSSHTELIESYNTQIETLKKDNKRSKKRQKKCDETQRKNSLAARKLTKECSLLNSQLIELKDEFSKNIAKLDPLKFGDGAPQQLINELELLKHEHEQLLIKKAQLSRQVEHPSSKSTVEKLDFIIDFVENPDKILHLQKELNQLNQTIKQNETKQESISNQLENLSTFKGALNVLCNKHRERRLHLIDEIKASDPFVSSSFDRRVCLGVAADENFTGIKNPDDRDIYLFKLKVSPIDVFEDHEYVGRSETPSSSVVKNRDGQEGAALYSGAELITFYGFMPDEIVSYSAPEERYVVDTSNDVVEPSFDKYSGIPYKQVSPLSGFYEPSGVTASSEPPSICYDAIRDSVVQDNLKECQLL
ncbi:MAG: hypothetical protein EP298_03265 [Gammaproteobacteria bacterium]|nr:MAG: hypothetical protein EP298_03265 [Gammaproteobacteria bacterium]UTW43555.1 hypothetical protein KFE69_05550 [bacterium SCSIO 12844]